MPFYRMNPRMFQKGGQTLRNVINIQGVKYSGIGGANKIGIGGADGPEYAVGFPLILIIANSFIKNREKDK